MTAREIIHTFFFIILGLVSLCEVKGAKKPRKYISLAVGILSLLIALWDILIYAMGIRL